MVVAGGRAFDPKEILVAGKVTIIDYFADWCFPCNQLEMELWEALGSSSEVAVVRVDIVDWDTPAAQNIQGVTGLPVLALYDADGKFVKRLVTDEAFEFRHHLKGLHSPPAGAHRPEP